MQLVNLSDIRNQWVVGSGKVLAANMKISAANGVAFVDLGVPNILNKPRHLLRIRDSVQRIIEGWIKTTGTGETLGTDLVTDGGFTAITKAAAKNVVGITKANPGVVTFSAGHGYANGYIIYFSGLSQMTELNGQYWKLRGSSGNTFQLTTVWDTTSLDTSGYGAAETTGGSCAQSCTFTSWTLGNLWYVAVDGAGALQNEAKAINNLPDNRVFQTLTGLGVVGALYKLNADFVVTSGTACFRFSALNGLQIISTSGNKSDYVTSTSINPSCGVNTVTTFNGTVDNLSAKKVLTPSATGVTIVSEKGGNVFNWAYQQPGFNYNDTKFTYEIIVNEPEIPIWMMQAIMARRGMTARVGARL